MATYIQQGEFVDYTPSGAGVAAGDVIALGNDFFGVALRDIADGEKGALATGGIFEFVSSGSVAAGALVFWDSGNKHVSTAAVSNTYIGRASAAAADNKCRVFLNATNIGNYTTITPGTAPLLTQEAIGDLTATAPGEATAGLEDQDNTNLLADLAAIRTVVANLVTDAATLKTAVNAAKDDIAAVVAALPSEVLA